MSDWMYLSQDVEQGPVSFTRLARLLADGVLEFEAPVCRQGAEDWQPASSVVGLLRTAQKLQTGPGRRQRVKSRVPVESSPARPHESRSGGSELDNVIRNTRQRLHDTAPEQAVDRRHLLGIWFPIGLVGTIIGGAIAFELMHDPFANKSFED